MLSGIYDDAICLVIDPVLLFVDLQASHDTCLATLRRCKPVTDHFGQLNCGHIIDAILKMLYMVVISLKMMLKSRLNTFVYRLQFLRSIGIFLQLRECSIVWLELLFPKLCV